MGLKRRLTLQIALLVVGCVAASGWVLVTSLDKSAARAHEVIEAQAQAEKRFAVVKERSRMAAEAMGTVSIGIRLELLCRRALMENAARRVSVSWLLASWLLDRSGGGGGLALPRGARGAELDRAVATSTWPDEHVSWMAIFNRHGKMVARSGDALAKPADGPASVAIGVRQALQGVPWSGVGNLPVRGGSGYDSSVHWLTVQPVRSADGRLAGAVAAGQDLSQVGRWLTPLVESAGPAARLTVSWEEQTLAEVVPQAPEDNTPAPQSTGGGLKTITGTPDLSGTSLVASLELTVKQPSLVKQATFVTDDLMRRGLLSLGIIAITAGFLIPLIGRLPLSRLNALTQRARAISLGQLDRPPPGLDDDDQAGELARAVERMRIAMSELVRRQPRRHRWR